MTIEGTEDQSLAILIEGLKDIHPEEEKTEVGEMVFKYLKA